MSNPDFTPAPDDENPAPPEGMAARAWLTALRLILRLGAQYYADRLEDHFSRTGEWLPLKTVMLLKCIAGLNLYRSGWR